MKDMNAEIQKIIENDLPRQVGKALKERLEQADKDRENLSISIQTNKEYIEKVTNLRKEIEGLKQTIGQAGDLDKREKEINEKEYKQELFEAKAFLNASNETNKKIMNFVDSLMRNTTYREEHFKNLLSRWDNQNNEFRDETGNTTTKTAE